MGLKLGHFGIFDALFPFLAFFIVIAHNTNRKINFGHMTPAAKGLLVSYFIQVQLYK